MDPKHLAEVADCLGKHPECHARLNVMEAAVLIGDIPGVETSHYVKCDDTDSFARFAD